MFFSTIRITFWSITFIVTLFLIRKVQVVNKRRLSIFIFIVSVILMTISAFIPIENSIITFSSLESAYNYNNSGTVKLIVNGENTDFVVAEKGDSDVYLIIPKVNDGWKLGIGVDTKKVLQLTSNGIVIYVYQYKNTEDYYVTVLDTNGGYSDITDNRNSKFKHLEKINNVLNKKYCTYYTYINNLDEQYYLNINNKSIKILN